MNASDVHEPLWLIRLREIDPAAAEVFEANPGSMSKLDMLIAGVADNETKVAIIRSALAGGVDINDPAVNLALMVMGVQKLISVDFTDLIDGMSRAARAGTAVIEQIRDSTADTSETLKALIQETNASFGTLIVSGLDDIKETARETIHLVSNLQKESIDAINKTQTQALESIAAQTQAISSATKKSAKTTEAFSKYLSEFNTQVTTTANEAVNAHTKRHAQDMFDRDMTAHTETMVKSITAINENIDAVRAAMAPSLLVIEKQKSQNAIIIGSLKISRHVWYGTISGAIGGAIFATLLFGFIANATYFGLNTDLVNDISAGRFYRMTYASLTKSCQNQFVSAAKTPGGRR